jgi:hypothetical protein
VARTLTVRLDDETAAALAAQEAAAPERSAAELIREAIGASSSVVYCVRRSDRAVKVGCTASIKTRLADLEVECGQVTLEALLPGGREDRDRLHEQLRDEQLGATEWFRGDRTEAVITAIVRRWGKSFAGMAALHVCIPKDLFARLRDTMRKDHSMSLSDAVRVALEAGLR